MCITLVRLWNDERAAIVSAELVAVMTCSVLALVVGLKDVSDAVNAELNDLAQAIGSLDQSFAFNGIRGCQAFVAGSCFVDTADICHCVPVLPLRPSPEIPQQALPPAQPMTVLPEGPGFPPQPPDQSPVEQGTR